MSTSTVAGNQVVHFPSFADGKRYLDAIVETDYRVRVVHGPDSNGLPKNWPIWFRDLVMDLAPPTEIAVRIEKHRAYVGSDMEGKALHYAGRAIQAMHALPPNPLVRIDRSRVMGDWWVRLPSSIGDIHQQAEVVQAIIAATTEPKGCQVRTWGSHMTRNDIERVRVTLTHGRRGALSHRELCQLFEFRFELAALAQGVPLQ